MAADVPSPAGDQNRHRAIVALAGPRPLLTKLARSASHGVANRSPEAEYTSGDRLATVSTAAPAPEPRRRETSERRSPMRKPIRKAVLPVAGLGTRFLPATKAVPKEMLTVVDRPILQHVVDEARAAGIEKFIFVTGRNKGVIEDHFDIAYELDDTLRRRGRLQQIEALAGRHAARRRGDVHAPASAARTRPCGMVRARPHRPRAVRAAAARHGHGGRPTRRPVPRPMCGSLSALRRQCRRRGGGFSRRNPVLRRRRHWRGRRPRFRDQGHGRKAAEGHRAVEPDHSGCSILSRKSSTSSKKSKRGLAARSSSRMA